MQLKVFVRGTSILFSSSSYKNILGPGSGQGGEASLCQKVEISFTLFSSFQTLMETKIRQEIVEVTIAFFSVSNRVS